MSKSLGNGIEPEEVIKKYGADVLRLWVASVDFTEDVRLSDTILDRLSRSLPQAAQTRSATCSATCTISIPTTDAVPGEMLAEIDQWILMRAEDLVARCRAWYDEFAFHKVYRAVYDFATVDLSAVYFDVLKDRLYTSAAKSKARRSAQTALYRLLDALVRLLAPILSFTTEEVWGYMGRPGSVHTALFPEPAELTVGIGDDARKRAANWDRLMEVRDGVLKSLDTARRKSHRRAAGSARSLSADGDLVPLA